MGEAASQVQANCCSGKHGDESSNSFPGSYSVVFDKNSGHSQLGLDVEEDASVAYLLIKSINGGLARNWNTTHDQKIRSGDRIVQVNGVSSDAAAMMARCRTDQVLRMCIQPCRESAAADAVKPTSSLRVESAHERAARRCSDRLTSEANLTFMQDLGIPKAKAQAALEKAKGELPEALKMCNMGNS